MELTIYLFTFSLSSFSLSSYRKTHTCILNPAELNIFSEGNNSFCNVFRRRNWGKGELGKIPFFFLVKIFHKLAPPYFHLLPMAMICGGGGRRHHFLTMFGYNVCLQYSFMLSVTRDAMGQYIVPTDGKPLTSLGKSICRIL